MASVASCRVGKIDNIKAGIKQGNGFFYVPEARSWITEYPAEALPLAETVYPESVLGRHACGTHAS